MTNEDMLAAIGKMFAAERAATDKKIGAAQAASDAKFETVNRKIDAAQAATDAKLGTVNQKVEATQKETMDMLQEEMQNIAEVAADKAVQRVQALLENKEDKQIQLLMEGQKEILRRLPVVEEQGKIKSRVTTLEHVTAKHTHEIQKLQRQA